MTFPEEIGSRSEPHVHIPLSRSQDGVDALVQPVKILLGSNGQDNGKKEGQDHTII